MSQLQKIAQEESKLEMTPMIDVTFLLLIFFMCTIKFKTLEGKLSAYLPKDVGMSKTDEEPKEKVEIKLIVVNPGNKLKPGKERVQWDSQRDEGTRFVYDKTRTIAYTVNGRKFTDVDDLTARLTKLHLDDEERGCTIDAGKDTIYEDVVTVLDAVIQADFTDVTFAGAAN